MGKLLQIRVSAWTYREEDVVRPWHGPAPNTRTRNAACWNW